MGGLDTSKTVASASLRGLDWLWSLLRGRVVEFVGGPARARVVVLFGCVLALSSAQISTVGAVAPELESSLHLDNTQIGLLNSVTLIIAAVAVIPVGLVVDRIKRIPMLSISIVLWSIATILGAVASSYGTLLITRVALGVVSATAGPAIASLTGDYFPPRERGRVYGYILTGEILGTAIGFVICGNAASAFGWRVSFWILAIPGFFLARSLWRTVPEPLRGGHSRLERGVMDLRSPNARVHEGELVDDAPQGPREHDLAFEIAEEQGYRPDPKLILDRDPDRMSLLAAVRYILSIPTNTLLIISSALGYFFYSGLQTFAVVFVVGHFHTSQGAATLVLGVLVIGALLGTLLSGPLCDLFTRHGKLAARVWIPAVCNLSAGAVLIPGLLANHLSTSLPFDFVGVALIAAANPPLDAARLDIMPSGLWGRAESTRTFLRSIAQAIAPLVFGGVADVISGFVPHQAPVGTHTGQIVSGTGTGLQISFLIMLAALIAGGWFLLKARPSYPRDVATAAAGWSPLAPEHDGGAADRAPVASGVMATDRRTEDPTVVVGDAAIAVADEDPTAVTDEDRTVVADRDPTLVAGDDPTVVAGDDPTVVDRRGARAPDGEDPTEPLFWPRDSPPRT